jgi:hypothetical protein
MGGASGLGDCAYPSAHYVLWCVLHGIVALNTFNIVHRDVKPANIMLFPSSLDMPRIALCDYGSMRMVYTAQAAQDTPWCVPTQVQRGHDTSTLCSSEVCTRQYAPPEEQSGAHRLNFDVFSACATVLHFMGNGVDGCSSAPTAASVAGVCTDTNAPVLAHLLRMGLSYSADRPTASQLLTLFAQMLPTMARRFSAMDVAHTRTVTARLAATSLRWGHEAHVLVAPSMLRSGHVGAMKTQMEWRAFWSTSGLHAFVSDVWPWLCTALSNYSTPQPPLVGFYVLNLVFNMCMARPQKAAAPKADTSACGSGFCYVHFVPAIVYTATLLCGNTRNVCALDIFERMCEQLQSRCCVMRARDDTSCMAVFRGRIARHTVNWLPISPFMVSSFKALTGAFGLRFSQ